MSQIRDKKAHKNRIATMNPINTKACNSLSCTLLLIVYYLFPYRNHLTSSNIITIVYQFITLCLVQIWLFYNQSIILWGVLYAQ